MVIFSGQKMAFGERFESMSVTTPSGHLAGSHSVGYLPQIGCENRPAHPAPHAGFPMGQTPVQPKPPAQDADAALNPSPKPKPSPGPRAALLRDPRWRGTPGVGDHPTLAPELLGPLFVVGALDPAIASAPMGRRAESDDMPGQTGPQVWNIEAQIGHEAILSDEAALHLAQPHLAAALYWLAGLVPLDDPRRGREQPPQLLSRGPLDRLQDPRRRLT
jgi:hypothetical protein